MTKNLVHVLYTVILICVMFVGCDRTIIVNEVTHSSIEVTEMTTTVSHEHNFIYHIEKRANCAEEGINKGICVDCDFEVTTSISKTEDHNWGKGEVIKAASFMEEGEVLYTCERCLKTKVTNTKKAGLVSIAEAAEGICEVTCDYEVKTTDDYSYKISAYKDNAISIIENIKVEPFTWYMVSVDVKTENVVESDSGLIPVGAHININNRKTVGIEGSVDWQTVQLCIGSDSQGLLTLNMNLGSLTNKCSGTVWFDNVRAVPVSEYEGTETRWKFLFVLLGNTSLNTYDEDLQKQINISHAMTDAEVKAITKSINDFEKDLTKVSEGKINTEVTMVKCDANISSYEKGEYGYHIAANEAFNYANEQKINVADYDHVVFVASLPDIPREYFGLGGTFIRGSIGFSFIMYGSETTDPTEYCYNVTEKSWPAGLYVHEFIHSIESYARRLSMSTVPSADGAYTYGYEDVDGWRTYYGDVINNRVSHEGSVMGVDPKLWAMPPRLLGYIK